MISIAETFRRTLSRGLPSFQSAIVLISFLVLYATGGNGQQGVNTNAVRTWTAKSGSTVEARFVGIQDSRLTIETTNGLRKVIDVSLLSKSDQDYIACDAPVPPLSRLYGKWRGTASMNGSIDRLELTFKKPGAKLTAQGWISEGLSSKQVADAIAKKLKKDSTAAFATVVDQTFDVTVEEDSITLKGVQAKPVFEGVDIKSKWTPDLFVGKIVPPGYLVGSWKSTAPRSATNAPKDGVFYFYREDMFTKPPALTLEKGKTLELTCLDGQSYHYCCYIPKNYDPAVPAPVVINKNPGGNGKPLSTKIADELGWIMVGLRESSNTALDSSANCVAALFDLRRRLNIDMRRIYFTGFSGRARQSAWEAIGFPDECAGIFCIGAGFSQYGSGPRTGQYKIPPLNIPVCFLVGKTDMNNKEVVGYVFPEEQKRKRVCKLIVHPGGHEWGPATDQETGLRWLNEQWKEPPPRSK